MTSPPDDDATLLAALRAGQGDALESLLAKHAPTVMRFAMKMCRDPSDAEDVLQETLFAAARALRELRHDGALSTWLYAVARSQCVKKRRRSRHAPRELLSLGDLHDDAVATAVSGPDDDTSRREVVDALSRAVAGLDDLSREVILLRDVEGLTAGEVAVVIGISVDAVKSRLHRARASLRERMAAFDPAGPLPTTPSDPACPEVIEIVSRHLEGDLSPEACDAMQAHLASCTSCSAACVSLKGLVGRCHASRGEGLSPAIAERVRSVVHAASVAR